MSKPALELINANFKVALHVTTVAIPVGICVGAAIAGFDYAVNTLLWGTFLKELSPLSLCALPMIGMLLTATILRIFKVKSTAMADEIVHAYHNPQVGIRYTTILPKLAASMATMGFGGSAGMEGASKWLGGVLSAWLQTGANRWRSARWLHGKVEVTMLAGAAAGISAIFRAPLTGAIMGIESPYKKDLAHDALLHALVASAVSFAVFAFLRNGDPYFPIHFRYALNVRDLLLCMPLGLAAGLSSHVFLACLTSIKRFAVKLEAHWFLRALLGGAGISLIAIVTLLTVGAPVTLQAGLPVANALLNGNYTATACAVIFVGKLLATAVTFGMGGVGGLFVPSAVIGAALGALADVSFAPSQPGLFTLVGIAAFTGASYNSLLFAAVFIAEATGSPALVVPGLIASSIAYMIATGVSNSSSQKISRIDVTIVPTSEPGS